jgi:hypothetical protein
MNDNQTGVFCDAHISCLNLRAYKNDNFLFIMETSSLEARNIRFVNMTPKYTWFLHFHGAIMWSSLVKIQYTELKLCGNEPVVKKFINSNGDLELCCYKYNFWKQDRFRTITLVLYIGSLPNMAKWLPCGRGKTLIYLGVIMSKLKVTSLINIRYKELKLFCGNLCGRPPDWRRIRMEKLIRITTDNFVNQKSIKNREYPDQANLYTCKIQPHQN